MGPSGPEMARPAQLSNRWCCRLGAQSFRFLQLNPQVMHLEVVVVVPHRRLKLGPDQLPRQLQAFLDRVIWLSLEELGQQADLDPLLALLTLPVRPEAELKASTQQILALPLQQLESLAEALLDFAGATDLAAWLNGHSG